MSAPTWVLDLSEGLHEELVSLEADTLDAKSTSDKRAFCEALLSAPGRSLKAGRRWRVELSGAALAYALTYCGALHNAEDVLAERASAWAPREDRLRAAGLARAARKALARGLSWAVDHDPETYATASASHRRAVRS